METISWRRNIYSVDYHGPFNLFYSNYRMNQGSITIYHTFWDLSNDYFILFRKLTGQNGPFPIYFFSSFPYLDYLFSHSAQKELEYFNASRILITWQHQFLKTKSKWDITSGRMSVRNLLLLIFQTAGMTWNESARKFLFTIIRSSVSPVGILILIIVYLPSLSVRKSRRQSLINKFDSSNVKLKS